MQENVRSRFLRMQKWRQSTKIMTRFIRSAVLFEVTDNNDAFEGKKKSRFRGHPWVRRRKPSSPACYHHAPVLSSRGRGGGAHKVPCASQNLGTRLQIPCDRPPWVAASPSGALCPALTHRTLPGATELPVLDKQRNAHHMTTTDPHTRTGDGQLK